MGNTGSGSGLDASGSNTLHFHRVHGGNIRLSNKKTVACRVKKSLFRRSPSGDGAAFSNRPIKPDEKIFLKILGIDDVEFQRLQELELGLGLMLGFTKNNPKDCRWTVSGVPLFMLLHSDGQTGYWTGNIWDRLSVGSVVHFWYTPSGEIKYGVDGEYRGELRSGLDVTGCPLWMALDVDGYSGIRLLAAIEGAQVGDRDHVGVDIDISAYLRDLLRPPPTDEGAADGGGGGGPDDVDDGVSSSSDETTTPAARRPRFTTPDIVFHTPRGRSAELDEDKRTAWIRTDGKKNRNGYLFSSRPLVPGESVVIKVAQTSDVSPAPGCSFGIGLTSCDPAELAASDLPDDPDDLLDRPKEYWVVANDAVDSPHIVGDTLSFMLCRNGDVTFWKNELPPRKVLSASATAPLWMFFNIREPLRKIAIVEPLSLWQTRPDECIVCSEKPVDSVLSTCGHMCMCLQCACEQWAGRGSGECPLCRAAITGVNKVK